MRGSRSGGRPARLRTVVLFGLLGGLTVLGLSSCAGPGRAPDTAVASGTADGPGVAPAGLGPSPVTSPVALRTVMKQFAPLDPDGRLTVPAQPFGTGTCFATSIAVPLSGVYRCLSRNTILDPCFAAAHEAPPASVVCFADPWAHGRILTLTRALPTYDPDLDVGNPWALELANGARCVSVTGAVPTLGDVDLSYQCDGNTVAGLTADDAGDLTAHYGPATGPLEPVGVAVAWRGRSYRLAG